MRAVRFAVATAQPADVPLQNWTVPPYLASGVGGIRPMTHVSPCSGNDSIGVVSQ